MLTGLDFMHTHSIFHCDLKPENVCVKYASRCQFKIIDFGSAVLAGDCRNSYVQSRWYRAPEVILGLRWTSAIDMWGLGCIIAELLLGQPLFHGNYTEAVLAAHEALLGRLPQHMMDASPLADTLFEPQMRQLFVIDPPDMPKGAYTFEPRPTSLRKLLGIEGQLADFLEGLLQLDPEKRLTTAQALRHPWLVENVAKPCETSPNESPGPADPLRSLATIHKSPEG